MLLIKKVYIRNALKILLLRNIVIRKMLDNFAMFLKLCQQKCSEDSISMKLCYYKKRSSAINRKFLFFFFFFYHNFFKQMKIPLFSFYLFIFFIWYILYKGVTYKLKYIQCEEQMKNKLCTRVMMQNASERGCYRLFKCSSSCAFSPT